MVNKRESGSEATPGQVISEIDRKMDRSIEALKVELGSLRTGRAAPALVENLTVDYYWVRHPAKADSFNICAGPRAILVQPWDKGSLREIERSLMQSEMGFNPSTTATALPSPIPPLNQERRKELVRLLKKKSKRARCPSATYGGTAWNPCGKWKRIR